MNELLDTTIIIADTISNTPIHIHETIKLFDNNNSGLTIWIPLLVGVFSLLFTIGFSLYQLRKERKEKRLQVKPLLSVFLDTSDNQLTMYLDNNGLGTTFINKIECSYDNKVFYSIYELFEYIRKAIPKTFVKNEPVFDKSPRGFYIKKENRVRLFKFELLDNEYSKIFKYKFSKISMKFYYENIYNEPMKPEIFSFS